MHLVFLLLPTSKDFCFVHHFQRLLGADRVLFRECDQAGLVQMLKLPSFLVEVGLQSLE